MYGSVSKIAYSTIVFAITAFILSIIGLISVISLIEKKKQKEFAIKKVFGGNTKRIIKEFIVVLSWYILPSLIISSVIAYLGTQEWLQGFVYKAPYPYIKFIIAILLIYLLIIVLVYVKVKKTASLSPSTTLKYD